MAYVTDDGTQAATAISPMQELAGLRAQHEGLMKQHAQLRDQLVGRLRASIVRLDSECAEMANLLQYLCDLDPVTAGNAAAPSDRQRMELERLKHELAMAEKSRY